MHVGTRQLVAKNDRRAAACRDGCRPPEFLARHSGGKGATHNFVRPSSARYSKPVAILADLQGPKIRTGALEQGKPVHLHFGQRFVISTKKVIGTDHGVSTTFLALPESVHKGDRILLNDGEISLRVVFHARARSRLPGGKWRRTRRKQGNQSARSETENSVAHSQGSPRLAVQPPDGRELCRAKFCAHGGGRAGGESRHRPRGKRYSDDRQTREAGSYRQPRGDPGGCRRRDGGARRLGRGDEPGKSARCRKSGLSPAHATRWFP